MRMELTKTNRILLLLSLFFSICSCSTSTRNIKANITPSIIEETYKNNDYLTWLHEIEGENKDFYKYYCEIKVFNKLDEEDYLFIYFFNDSEVAKEYEESNASKSNFFMYFFTWIFGNPTNVNFNRYEYMVVESYDNEKCKSKDDMIRIFENTIYE